MRLEHHRLRHQDMEGNQVLRRTLVTILEGGAPPLCHMTTAKTWFHHRRRHLHHRHIVSHISRVEHRLLPSGTRRTVPTDKGLARPYRDLLAQKV